ncbi:hypothetical protein D9599_04915 [Roseomonas sp. KE2513]|uniref:hypothetical protein n=1 Tax=Roseomonas sp. KE2513 TaxID=2479202 RepID=UPI0018DFC82C|nr:hypothetical protein [Roseomonas sp. KE2513]MBI0534913.1 hypothetical protein [Roseomonas sp. KE2513]
MTGTTALIPCPTTEPIPGGPLASWCQEGVSLGMSFADAFPSATADARLAGEGLDEAGSALSISFDLFPAEEPLASPAARHAHVERAKDIRRRPLPPAAGAPATRCWTAPRFSRRRTAAALRRA